MKLGALKREKPLVQRQSLNKIFLQFGEGNFLRAFIDWMIHEMNTKIDFQAGVVIVQPLSSGLVDKLSSQNGLYNLYLNGIQNGDFISTHSLVDVIREGINPYSDFDNYMKQAVNPDLRFIISNTTEAGIQFNPSDCFEDAPASSFPGKLTQLLFRRFRDLPYTQKLVFLPCELINKNGEKLKESIIRYIEHWDLGDEFHGWLDQSTIFCNTLVDRIVPGYPKKHVKQYWNELGYEDELIVEGEIFHLWVIEGPQEVQELLPLQEAGLNVIFTNDLNYYRTRKVRILNGTHTALVPVAYLYGLDFVRESVENEVVGSFAKRVIFEEIIPSLDGRKEELEQYAHEIIDRFRNPAIQHELIAISLNSFSKFRTRVLPSILGYYEREKQLPRLLLTSFAALICLYRGERFGVSIPLKDEPSILDFMKSFWSEYISSPEDLGRQVNKLLHHEIFGLKDLVSIPGASALISEKILDIQTHGMAKTIISSR